MGYSVKGTTVTMTRGDTVKLLVQISYPHGAAYVPQSGDSVRFAMKKTYGGSEEPLILKDIPTDTMLLRLDPEDTKGLACRSYVYDIELTNAAGEVDTFISRATLRLTEEVH